MPNETILNVFPGASDQQRLVLVRTKTICGLEHLVLRQETHSPDVGWFVQNQVAIEPGQVAGLKMTLTAAGTPATSSARAGIDRNANLAPCGKSSPRPASSPVILQFEAAS